MTFSLLPRRYAAAVAAAAVALPAVGCGGSDGSAGGDAGADPAASLPAAAPLYVEAQLRPQGEQRDGALTVGRKLLRTDDPEGKVIALFDRAMKRHGGNFERDIAPWLGNRAGLAVTSLSARGRGIALAIASRDDDKARAFLDAQKARRKAVERTYHDEKYALVRSEDSAAALVGHTVVLGTEAGVKAAIDASKGDALSESKTFKEARGEVGTDGLAYAYLDPARLFTGVLGQLPGGGAGAGGMSGQTLSGLVTASGVRSVAASLDVAPNALALDAAVLGGKDLGAGTGNGPGAAAAVPAGAWLSAGFGDLGATLRRSLAQSSGAGFGGLSFDQIQQQLKQQLDVDVEQDFLSWMGDGAVFVRGTSKGKLSGALVVASKDPKASRAAIGKLTRVLTAFGSNPRPLRGVAGAHGVVLRGPQGRPITIAAQGDRFVVALGRPALAAALRKGGQQLGATDAYKSAVGLLEGVKPSFFLNTPAALKLIASLAGSDPDFKRAKPTLDVLGPAAAGVERQGDATHIKVAVGIR